MERLGYGKETTVNRAATTPITISTTITQTMRTKSLTIRPSTLMPRLRQTKLLPGSDGGTRCGRVGEAEVGSNRHQWVQSARV